MIDIITPTFHNNDMLKNYIYSITTHRPLDSRLIIIDNGFETAHYESESMVVIPVDDNLGFIKGTNLGLARSTGDYIVFQNDDTCIYNNIYGKMKKLIDDGVYDIVGPVFSPSYSWQCVNSLSEVYHEHAATQQVVDWDQKLHETEAKRIEEKYAGRHLEASNMVIFACAMISRKVVQKIGYLSEAYGMGLGDDDDYCWRAKKAGFKIGVALDAYVYHAHRTTFKKLMTEEQIKEAEIRAREQFKVSRD